MAKERLFFTGSTRIIGDPRPSGLDLRVYACVSLHDGMSLLKKNGRGCYATFATLTAEIGCDAANLSRSLKRLVEWGYLTEERQEDRRRKTYRVTFESADSWQSRQQPADEIVGNGESGNGSNPPQDEQHYSSLKGLDTLEREKLDSSEEAHFVRGSPERMEFEDNVGAQLAVLERAMKAGENINAVEWYRYVGSVWEDEEHRGRATRLADELAELMTEEEFERCAAY
ncbi:MAG: MarR family transcriptional regulator [Sphingomicrobium sp.]